MYINLVCILECWLLAGTPFLNNWIAMYDTIKAYYQGELAEIELLPNKENFVPNIDASGDLRGYKAKFGNIYIFLNLYHKLSFEGSLSRFAFNENFSTMTRAAAKDAIEEICNFCGIPPEKWIITRLDISTILPATTKIEILQNVLGSATRLKRWTCGKSGIYWGNSQRQLVIYDKTLWAKETNTDLPEVLKGFDWIRAELRLQKNIGQQTKSNASLSLLYDEEFYLRVCKLWKSHFLSIKKQSGGIFQKKTNTAKAALGQFIAMLQCGDNELFERMVKQAASNCEKTIERSRFKQTIKKYVENNSEPEEKKDAAFNSFQRQIKCIVASH